MWPRRQSNFRRFFGENDAHCDGGTESGTVCANAALDLVIKRWHGLPAYAQKTITSIVQAHD
jgi:hypothetical protein